MFAPSDEVPACPVVATLDAEDTRGAAKFPRMTFVLVRYSDFPCGLKNGIGAPA